jgi:hypothetical protein
MKKFLRIIAAISIIAFVIAGADSFAKKHPGKTTQNSNHGITYLVTVTHTYGGGVCHSYQIILRDEDGNQVGPALPYYEGIDNYIIRESGPVTGTRIAYLERIDGAGQVLCNQVLQTQPDQITGDFRNGYTYIFSLYPTINLKHD